MRDRGWLLIGLVVVAIGCAGCGHFRGRGRGLTAERRAAVEDGVRWFAGAVARNVTRDGPVAWRKYFEEGPEFFMAVNGTIAFASGAAAERAIPEIARNYKRIELRWGDDLRVDVLTERFCVVGASYTEVVELQAGAEGPQGTQRGYFTGVAEERDGEWRFRDVHWSSAEVGGGGK